MSCDPNSNSLNPPAFPPTILPGFGISFSPIQIPVPNFDFPEGFPEDLLEMINALGIGSVFDFNPNLDDLTNSILKGISSVLSQVAPFMSLYSFFQALLNMVLCVMEILCAIPNPWRMAKAMRRLFKRCLPDFLNLFPWLALLAMLIALLLLILALIQYIIDRILALIEELIRNLTILGEGVLLQNDDATVAAAQKIAQLLCLIDNLLAVLVAIAALLSIFEALAGITGSTVCGRGGNTFGDDVGCCDESVCPNFIANSPDGLIGMQGELIYHNQIRANDTSFPLFILNVLPSIRSERWQFVDQASGQEFSFREIIDIVIDRSVSPPIRNNFYPDGVFYDNDANVSKIPYSLSMTISDFNPNVFHPTDFGGTRGFLVEEIVVNRPYVGVRDAQNSLDTSVNSTGTLPLIGGLVYEDDGNRTPYLVNGTQATLQTFIHEDPTLGDSVPIFEDGYVLSNIEFNLDINHEILMDQGLITLGCLPDIAIEAEVVNARVGSIGFDSITNRLGDVIPDALGAQECAAAAINKFRKDVSIENAAIMQQELLDCLNKLSAETEESILTLILNGVSIFTSRAEIEPDVQFITRPILTTVTLRDAGGSNVAVNLPESIYTEVAANIEGSVTLGEIADFEYDGYGAFLADITSDTAGDGYLTVSFSNNTFSEVLNENQDNLPTIIQEIQIPFTFVGIGGAVEREAQPRRDATDVSRSDT